MMRVFEDAGFGVSRALDRGTFEVAFPIEATDAYRGHVEERDHLAVVASLRPFFAPASVAVIGASTRREAIGGIVFRNVIGAEFKGAAYPVNRTGEPVAGVRAYTSIEELPEQVDLAVICLPGARVLDSARSALESGIRALCVISAGFAEIGEEGRERQEQLLALVRAHGGRLVGPNCLGIAVAAPSLNATFGPRALPPGPIGFSSQSGALGLALLEKASERSLGFSSFISIGNKADVSSNDLLEYWEEDDEHGADRALPRVVRQSAPLRPDREPRRPQEADPRDEERDVDRGRTRRRLAHCRARRLGGGRRGAVPPGRRAPRGDARGADRRSGAALDAAACRAAGGSRSSRTRAVSGSSARTPARRRGSSCRSSRRRRRRSWPSFCPPRRAWPTRSTCSARRPRPATRRPCPSCSPIPPSTR